MANKRSKATEVEELYITTNPKGMSQQELANKFEMSIKTIAGIQQRFNEERTQQQAVADPTPVIKEETATRQTFVRPKNEQKKTKGIVIATQAASERMDDAGKASRSKTKKNAYANDYTTKTFQE